MRVIAVLPARNEAQRIASVIAGIKATRAIDKIIVVDDASDDGTAKVAARSGASVIRLDVHARVGGATKVGLAAALKANADVIVFLDADGQHEPKYIPEFVEEIKSGADFVIGRRSLSKYPLRKVFGNFVLRTWANVICHTGLKDPECGFRALSAKAARIMDLRASGYEICMDFLYNVWRRRLRIAQIDIMVPMYYVRKGTSVTTGFINGWHLLKRRCLG